MLWARGNSIFSWPSPAETLNFLGQCGQSVCRERVYDRELQSGAGLRDFDHGNDGMNLGAYVLGQLSASKKPLLLVAASNKDK